MSGIWSLRGIGPTPTFPPKKRKTPAKTHELVTVEFGNGGSKAFGYSTFSSPSVSEKGDYKEVRRETKEETIRSTVDPSQFVKVKNTTALFARGLSDPSQKFNIFFKTDD